MVQIDMTEAESIPRVEEDPQSCLYRRVVKVLLVVMLTIHSIAATISLIAAVMAESQTNYQAVVPGAIRFSLKHVMAALACATSLWAVVRRHPSAYAFVGLGTCIPLLVEVGAMFTVLSWNHPMSELPEGFVVIPAAGWLLVQSVVAGVRKKRSERKS